MSITVYTTPINEDRAFVLSDTTINVSQPTAGKELLMIYVEYIKGNETALCLDLGTVLKRVPGKPFKLSYIKDSTQVISNAGMLINVSGNYRIPLPISLNESYVELTASLQGGTTGTANIWMTPEDGDLAH